MTLFSNIFNKTTKTFSDAAAQLQANWDKIVAKNPMLKPVADVAVSVGKQQISNAFAFVDTSLDPHYAEFVSAVETASNTLITSLTKGLATPALPFIDVLVTKGLDLGHAALHAAEAQAKADWALPAPK